MIATSGRVAVETRGARRLRAVLAADRRELLALLPELRRVRTDDVHRARVLARRMRAILRTYGPAFDPTPARRARRLLKGLARELDPCRESSVREALIREVAGEAGGSVRPMPAALVAMLARERTDARRDARKRLGRADRAAELRAALNGLAVEEASGLEGMLGRLDRQAGRLRRRIVHGRGDEGLHRIRLAVKSLRYSLSPFDDVVPAACHRLHARLREAQERLGEQHDAALAIAWLEGARGPRGLVGRRLMVALRERERASRRAARGAVRRIDPAWRRWRAEAGEVTAAL